MLASTGTRIEEVHIVSLVWLLMLSDIIASNFRKNGKSVRVQREGEENLIKIAVAQHASQEDELSPG